MNECDICGLPISDESCDLIINIVHPIKYGSAYAEISALDNSFIHAHHLCMWRLSGKLLSAIAEARDNARTIGIAPSILDEEEGQ